MKKMYYQLLLLLVFMITVLYCSQIQAQKNSIIPKPESSLKRDTVLIIKEYHHYEKIAKMPETSPWEKKMPWISAIIVGVLAFLANIFISRNARKTSLEITEKQLDRSMQMAIAQIDLAKENSVRDFNKTVLSGNGQLWITDFRILISEIITVLSSHIVRGSISDQEFGSLKLLITKAELMLTEDSDIELENILSEILSSCYNIVRKNQQTEDLEDIVKEIKKLSLMKIKDKWKEVKSGN